MIRYFKVKGEIDRRAGCMRQTESGKWEFCFGLNIWRKTPKRAWKEYRKTFERKEGAHAR